MKSILISIRPKWVGKILNGEKTIEIRRDAPKDWKDYLSGKTKIKPEPKTGYIYCTKGNRFLFKDKSGEHFLSRCLVGSLPPLNAQVVAKFTLREVKAICIAPFGDELSDEEEMICSESRVPLQELVKYLREGMFGYVWRISDLQIFDKPKNIWEFEHVGGYMSVNDCPKKKRGDCNEGFGAKGYIGCERARLKRPPQSWCYVEVMK